MKKNWLKQTEGLQHFSSSVIDFSYITHESQIIFVFKNNLTYILE